MSEKRVDKEWKKQAREEKERLAKEGKEPKPGSKPGPPPEPSFSMIVSSFVVQALIALGEMENPVDGKLMRDLEAAKFSIDMLQVLGDKTDGNLDDNEKKMLEGALYDLRMRYVQTSS
ncbi:MAG: DUF1844 domain-containing protein [Planctomycetota bacterium]